MVSFEGCRIPPAGSVSGQSFAVSDRQRRRFPQPREWVLRAIGPMFVVSEKPWQAMLNQWLDDTSGG